MRPLPCYPDYSVAKPPVSTRWLSAGALLVLVGGGSAALLPSATNKTGIIAAGIVSAIALVGLAWMVRLLFYRVAVHNAFFYHQLVEYEQQQWWQRHCQTFALQQVVLLGPAGTSRSDLHRLLKREHRQPVEKKETGGTALRVAQISAENRASREIRLAETLVLEWQSPVEYSALLLLAGNY